MKNSPRYAPLFVALSVVLTTVPQAALAQVIARPAGASAAAPVTGVHGVSALPAAAAVAAPLSAAPSLTSALAAPSIAPQAAAPSAVAAAATAAPALAAAPAAAASRPAAAPTAESAATSVRTPGAAATGLAAEAAAYAADAESDGTPAAISIAVPARRGLISRLAAVATGRAALSSLFDASSAREKSAPVFGRMSLTEQKPILLPNSTRPDEAPTLPSPDRERTASVQIYAFPGARDVGGVFETAVLNANPNDVGAVVAAVKAMIDGNRSRYGVASADLRLINARKFEGHGDQADSIFVTFRQTKDNLLVNGGNLSFTLKVIKGKPMVVAQTGQVYPELDVDTGSTMSDDQIMAKIAERTGLPPQDVSSQFQFFEEKILYSRGAWRHVKLYVAEGLPFMVAVDLSSGLVFAWDNRTGAQSAPAAPQAAGAPRALVVLREKGLPIERVHALLSRHGVRINGYRAEDGSVVVSPAEAGADVSALMRGLAADANVARVADATAGAPGVGGTVAGRAVDHGPIRPDASIAELALSDLHLTIGGKTYTTDKDGRFSAPGLDVAPEGVTLTATLSGPHVDIQDSTGKTLTISVTLKPSDGAIQVLFNKDATLSDENALAQVAAFHKVNLVYNFLKARSLTTERMDKEALVVRTNVDDECNAYYTPGSPSLNFFKSSPNCVNSAYDTVADHEYGHYWDDMTGGIMNGGLSEGWGDTVSMYLLNNPVIGEHFLKNPRTGPDGKPTDYIRHGENAYKYNEYDEVHEQGQAWQGFTWKLRKAMIAKLGYEAGTAMAEALVLPTMFAKAATIPDAMAQVLVNALKKDGTIAFEKEIRDIALFHGVTLPASPAAPLLAGLVSRFTAPLRRVTVKPVYTPQSKREVVSSFDALAAQLAAASGETGGGEVRQTLRFTAGAMLRGRVANEIRRYMDETGLKYQLHEYKSWLSSDYLLVIEGPQDEVQKHANAISSWLSSLERNG